MKKNVLICLVAISLLLGMLLIFLSIDTPTEVQPASTVSNGYEMLYTRDQTEVSKISVNVACDGIRSSFTLVSDIIQNEADGEIYVGNNMGQPFVVEGCEEFPLAASSWQMFILSATNLPVTGKFSSLDSASCGLDNPTAVIKYFYKDGSETTLTVGKKAPDGTSCFVQMNDKSDVYLVPYDFYDIVCNPLNFHHRLPAYADKSVSDVVQFALLRPDGENIMGNIETSQNSPFDYILTSPASHPGNSREIQSLIKHMLAVECSGYETTVQSSVDLEHYGLSTPVRCLLAFSDGTVRDIQLGSANGNGQIYARVDRSGDVYLVDSALADPLTAASFSNLADKCIKLVPVSSVCSVSVETKEQHFILTPVFGEGEKLPSSYLLNGKEMTREKGSSLYSELSALMFDTADYSVTNKSDDFLFRISYLLKDDSIVSLTFCPYDEWYCQVSIDDATYFVRQSRIAKVCEAFETAMRNVQ